MILGFITANVILGFKTLVATTLASSFIEQRLRRRLVIEQPPLVAIAIRDDTIVGISFAELHCWSRGDIWGHCDRRHCLGAGPIGHAFFTHRHNQIEGYLLPLPDVANLLLLGVMGQAGIDFCIVTPCALSLITFDPVL